MDGDTLGGRIKELRENRGLTQQQLGELAGVGGTTIRAIETGRADPSYKVLVNLSKILDKTIDFLAFGDENKQSTRERSYSQIKLIRIIDRMKEQEVGVLLATAEAMQRNNEVGETDPGYDFPAGSVIPIPSVPAQKLENRNNREKSAEDIV